MKGIYLINPHGTWIIEGKKTATVKGKKLPDDYVDTEVYLCQDDDVLGIIKLSGLREINLKEFEELKDKHLISQDERKSWWPEKEILYYYDVEVLKKFSPPKKYEREQGVQTVIADVKLKSIDFEKLRLEEFRAEGIDYDLENPKERFRQLIADLRYLGNAAYPKLKRKEEWGEWTLEDVYKYFAKIVDTLRGVYFPIIPPSLEELYREYQKKDPEEAKKSSFWQCYKEAEKYMESKPPKNIEEVKEWDEKRKAILKKDFQFYEEDPRIKFLGTRGLVEEHEPGHNFHSGVLITSASGKKLLVDLGEIHEKEVSELKPDYVILSHVHPDHVLGISPGTEVYMSKESQQRLEENKFKINLFKDREPFELGPFRITAIPVLHSIRAPCHNFLIEVDGKKIWYALDVLSISQDDRHEFLRGCDLYIADGSSLTRNLVRKKDDEIFGHSSVRSQMNWCLRAGIPRMVIAHLGKEAIEMKEEDLKLLVRRLSPLEEVGVAYDGAEFVLDATFKKSSGYMTTSDIEYKEILYARVSKEDLERTSNQELQNLHDAIHEIYQEYEKGKFKDLETVLNNHLFIVEELLDRGLRHTRKDKLDYLSLPMKSYEVLNEHEKLHLNLDYDDIFEDHLALEWRMKTLGLQHIERNDALDNFVKILKGLEVKPSGVKKGREIALEEILKYLKDDFKLRSPFLYLTGGIVNRGKTENDIDILINCSEEEKKTKLFKMLMWRILRAFPKEYWDRIQFIENVWYGPITDNIPIYDLTCERINPGNKIFQMSYDFEKKLVRAKTSELEREAEISKREDKVELFRFFLPLKPTRGYYPGEEQNIETFLEKFTEKDYPNYSSKKFDGVHAEIHKSKDRVEIYSEDGLIITKRFPESIKEIQKLKPDDLVLLSEIEVWEDKNHLPREVSASYIHEKGKPDETGIIFNIYDCVYFGDEKDIHKLGPEERFKRLESIKGFSQSTETFPNLKFHLNLVKHTKANSKEELRRITERLRKLPGSEGNVCSIHGAKYRLDGLRSGMIKFHNSANIAVIVLDKIETKTAGVFNYVYGVELRKEKVPKEKERILDSRRYSIIGKTFSTAEKMKIGDRFILEFETLNLIREEGLDYLTAWAPRFIRETEEQVDTFSSSIRKAEKGLCFQEKIITEERIIYKTFTIEKQITLSDVPPEEKQPCKFVMQEHFRGRSLHSDFRIEAGSKKDYLVGMTIDHLIKGAIKEPILTVEQAKRIHERGDYSKIDWKTGKFQLRRTAAGNLVPTSLRAQIKSSEPLAWVSVQGVTPKGRVGATKEYPGVFFIAEEGTAYWGAIKPYFKEFFLDGKKIKGRLVFRQLTPWTAKEKSFEDFQPDDFEKDYIPFQEGESLKLISKRLILPPSEGEKIHRTGIFFMAIQPLDQTPYVLSDRAIKLAWIPEFGYSALPGYLKKKVPEEFQYWKHEKESERIRIRDAYVKWLQETNKYDALKELQKSMSKSGKYVIQQHAWRGQKVIREGWSTVHWDLRIDVGEPELLHFVLWDNPLEVKQTSAKLKPCSDKSSMTYENPPPKNVFELPQAELKRRSIPFRTEMNPTLNTPAFIWILTKGECIVLEDKDVFKKIQFKTGALKGLWTFRRSSPEIEVWTAEKSQAAPETKSLTEILEEIKCK